MAASLTFLQSGVVQKAKIHRLLDFIDIITRQKNVRHLGLHKLNLLREFRVDFRVKQGFN